MPSSSTVECIYSQVFGRHRVAVLRGCRPLSVASTFYVSRRPFANYS